MPKMDLFGGKNKKNEYLFKKEYHERLEMLLKKHFGIEPTFSDNFSWGYTSRSFYVKTAEGKEYVAKVAEASTEKRTAVEKDIAITSALDLSVKTPTYLKTQEDGFFIEVKEEKARGVTLMKERLITLAPFLHGMPPFEMTFDIFRQAISLLAEIHKTQPGNIKEYLYKMEMPDEPENKTPAFLHGDLTPSNMLVSYGKLAAVVDFELAAWGPVEYDLSRCALLCWFHMSEKVSIKKVLDTVEEHYPSKLRRKTLEKYLLGNAEKNLANLQANKSRHEDKKAYRKEVKFAKKRLRIVKKSLC